MSVGDQIYPQADAWITAIHATATDDEPRGSGVVLDDLRILTCAHVVRGTTNPVWVAFPKAEDSASEERRMVERVVLPDARARVKDLAILILAESVPTGVTHAPLRCPRPGDLVSKRWWAFGFPQSDPLGNDAHGEVGSALGYGWIRLDTASRYPVELGFSGGGLWSPDYQAVVAIVSHANPAQGDGRAITLHQADQSFPDQNLRLLAEHTRATDAGPLALAAWGWSLASDSEGIRHWRPRARGVSIESERGYRFRGRTVALRAITTWLDRNTIDRRVLVVTGAPGAGKSAVLGRIVTTADKDAVAQLPRSDSAIRARVGSVACAVHAKGATALDVAIQIAMAASAAIPERIEDFAPALRIALEERTGSRFNVIIDALDEAATSAEARLVVSKVILPLAESCADVGAQVVVGSRRSDAYGDLLAAFGGVARLVDLDNREFFAEEDLAAYAYATLQLAGDEREGNPYVDDKIAGPVAMRIAALSDSNFLVAGLTARTHGLYDETPVNPATLKFSPKVDDAMSEYLRRIPQIGHISAGALLTALAFAESPGLTASLWRIAIKALGFGDIGEQALKSFARSSAASFLIESTDKDGVSTEFRLFHQALNDALRHFRATIIRQREDEEALTLAFMRVGGKHGWQNAPDYLLRSLPLHAQRAKMLDKLLSKGDYLLYVELSRVLQLCEPPSMTAGQRRLLSGLAPDVTNATKGSNRAAMFSVAAILADDRGLCSNFSRANANAPYAAAWTSAAYYIDQSLVKGDVGAISAVAPFTSYAGPALASVGYDQAIRIWDAESGTQRYHMYEWHKGQINDVCAFNLHGQVLLATVGDDRTIGIWNPESGIPEQALEGHDGWINAICAFTLNQNTFLATCSHDGTARIWDIAIGRQQQVMRGHNGSVRSIQALSNAREALLATAGLDGTVRIWDPISGRQKRVLEGHDSWINALCVFSGERQNFLAACSDDGKIWIWNLETGVRQRILKGHYGSVRSICAFIHSGYQFLATVGGDRTLRIWDPTKEAAIQAIPTRDDALSVTYIAGLLIAGTGGGLLGIRLHRDFITRSSL